MLYIIPLLLGILLISPLREKLSFIDGLVKKYPSLENDTRKIFLGQTLIVLTGFAVSAHTLWISNKISEGGSYCSAQNIFDCDSVIGDMRYNTVPFTEIPWGLLGFLAFTVLLYFVRTLANEPHADFVEKHIQFGKLMTVGGFFIIAANIAAFFGFNEIEKAYKSDAWRNLK
jgi:uncharacterized membrane protein